MRELLPTFVWPEDQFAGGGDVLDRVFVTSWTVEGDTFSFGLYVEGEIGLRAPWLPGVEIVLNAAADGGTEFGAVLSFSRSGGWSLTLTDLSLTLRWDGDLLVAMAADGAGGWVETGAPFGITVTGSMTIHSDWSVDVSSCPAVTIPPVQLSRTGVVISAESALMRLGSGALPSQLAALGYGSDFAGAYVPECTVSLPAGWTGRNLAPYTTPPPAPPIQVDAMGHAVLPDGGGVVAAPTAPLYVGPRLTFTNVAIGNDGFSGDIEFDVTASTDVGDDPSGNLVTSVPSADLLTDAAAGVSGLSTELFGFGLALQSARLSFRRGALTASSVDGSLKVPFLDTWFDVQVAITGDGGLEIGLATESGAPLADVEIPEVARFQLDSIGLSAPGDGAPAGIVLNGTVQPLLPIGGADWPALDLRDLTIHADGSISLPGGWLDLPAQYSVDFFGFTFEPSQLGFGTGELVRTGTGTDLAAAGAGDWRWIGLSGVLQLVEQLGISASVDGLKIAWRGRLDGSIEVQWTLSTLAVDVTTDAFSLHGSVSYLDDPTFGSGFGGGVELTLTTVGLSFDAQFIVGRTAPGRAGFAYWGVILDVDLPAGVPLGPTGVAFYGLEGVGMQNLTPDKKPKEDWYDGWYQRVGPDGLSGVTLAKFVPADGALGLGFGVSLGSAPDNGFTVNAAALLLILFPGPTILISGRAGYLSPRGALHAADPPFEALVVIESDGSVLFDVAAHYSPLDEHVLSIAGDLEVFYDGSDPDAWYIHLGQKPLDQRIGVTVLSLFKALGYLDIDRHGLATGFRIGFSESWDFGRLHVGFHTHISGNGSLSSEPLSVRGSAQLGGSIDASAFGISLAVAVGAGVSAQAYTPLRVHSDVEVTVDLPAPLPTLSQTVALSWENTEAPDYVDPVRDVSVVHAGTGTAWEPGLTESTAPTVPLDARPVVTFQHAVLDSTGFGQPAAYLLPPLPEQVGDHAFAYNLTEVALDYLDATGSYQAMPDLYGVWLLQGDPPADDPDAVEAGSARGTTKLEVWGRTPFGYEDHTTVTTLSLPVLDDPAFPCGADPELTVCVDWQDQPARTRFPRDFVRGGVTFSANGLTEVAVEPALEDGIDEDHVLGLIPGTVLVANLPAPSRLVEVSVEALGQVVLEAWSDVSGTPVLLDTRTIVGRENGIQPIVAEGITRVVLIALPAQDCAPWLSLLPKLRARSGPAAPPVEVPAGAVHDDLELPLPITTVPCCTLLYRLCYLTQAAYDGAADLVERRQAFSDWTRTWSGSARVLAPNTTYRMRVSVEATGLDAPSTFTRTRYFRTEGPPGFLTRGPDALAGLDTYVDRTAPPAGAGVTAPAHYTGHDVVVLYDRDYVTDLYAGRLYLRLLDANGRPVVGADGQDLLEASFTDPAHRVLTTGETSFLDAVVGSDCAEVSWAEVGPSTSQGYSLPPLAGRTLHQARLLGAWSPKDGIGPDGRVDPGPLRTADLREVFRWEFTTSRYAGFTEHMASYDPDTSLWDGAQAIRPAGLDLAAVVGRVLAVQESDPAWDEPEKAAAEALLELLGVPRASAPEGVEVTVIRDGDDAALALLLDSPEPLDWDRITVAVAR
ncbi:MAG TPA: hypothetical protein VIC57_05330, partial [Candidatus Dormibacteraeota bacterium]